jgi:hypothetical protein
MRVVLDLRRVFFVKCVLFLFRLWVGCGWIDFSGAVARANRAVSECTIRSIFRVA